MIKRTAGFAAFGGSIRRRPIALGKQAPKDASQPLLSKETYVWFAQKICAFSSEGEAKHHAYHQRRELAPSRALPHSSQP
jgi:hypothetical protein